MVDLPEPYATASLKTRRLVAVLEDWCPAIPGLFLYFAGNRHMPPGLRALIGVVKATQI